MFTRRRLIRAAPVRVEAGPQRQRQVDKVRTCLERERTSLTRWQKRLKRAFTAVEKCHKTISRLERRLRQLEDSR